MLRISKKADYGVFLLGAIARQGAYPGGRASDSVVSAHEVARQAGLNKSVVANLLKEFARHGMLESVRGLKGGYRLVRSPAEISLGDILEVVEGRFVLVDCVAAATPASSCDTDDGDGQNGHLRRGHAKARTAGRAGLLALAPSMHTEDAHDCALISFCPSKHPMRIVHERIAQLFREIHLDELCALVPTAGSTAAAARLQPTIPQSKPR